MKIGKMPRNGQTADLNKWYFGVEILARPPAYWKIFKPYLFIWCVKFLHNEVDQSISKKKDRVGGWWSFTFPYAIRIEISKY